MGVAESEDGNTLLRMRLPNPETTPSRTEANGVNGNDLGDSESPGDKRLSGIEPRQASISRTLSLHVSCAKTNSVSDAISFGQTPESVPRQMIEKLGEDRGTFHHVSASWLEFRPGSRRQGLTSTQ